MTASRPKLKTAPSNSDVAPDFDEDFGDHPVSALAEDLSSSNDDCSAPSFSGSSQKTLFVKKKLSSLDEFSRRVFAFHN